MNPAGTEPGKRALAVLSRVFSVAIFVWLGLLALLALNQRSMIYYPSRNDAVSLGRDARAQGFEPWKNAQGELIGYRSLPAPGDTRPPVAILVSHGNAGYALHRADYAPILRAAAPGRAVSVCILEYPGYGARPGQPSQGAFLAAAADALAQIPSGTPVILLGESIGTGVAAATASARPERMAGLLLLTPFDSLANVARHHYPLLPIRWLMRDQYPAQEWLKNYHGPVTVILAADDSIVPAKFGKQLHDSYAGPKQLIVADHADHNDLLHALPQSSWEQALQFVLPPQP
ncbi:MAG: alpha/beta hydrolase [Chthoniobacterales bacterium]|nr:alpha/beta hydrolase [Chthoniobacterales bacterium]